MSKIIALRLELCRTLFGVIALPGFRGEASFGLLCTLPGIGSEIDDTSVPVLTRRQG